MLFVYIIGGIFLTIILLYISFVVFINVRLRSILFKTGIEQALNEFINTKEFISESNYIGGKVEKKQLYRVSIEDNGVFNPTEVIISGLLLPRKKARYGVTNIFYVVYLLLCIYKRKWNLDSF